MLHTRAEPVRRFPQTPSFASLPVLLIGELARELTLPWRLAPVEGSSDRVAAILRAQRRHRDRIVSGDDMATSYGNPTTLAGDVARRLRAPIGSSGAG